MESPTPKRAQFSLSAPSSRSSSPDLSRSSSPGSDSDWIDIQKTVPSDVYDATLPWWRAAIRRSLVKMVERESVIIAKMQDYIRTPWLDYYFVYTSNLGTHTFFMIILPAFFFFGYDKAGRGLLIILALGVYLASVLKDLICSPRPFAPPVTRLTIGTHHLEYGFPSTHSTNSVSIALMLWSEFDRLAHPPSPEAPAILESTYNIFCVVLSIYAVSIVFGRLYTAMHSFIDCLAGVSLGVSIWWVHESFPGFNIYLPNWSWLSPLFVWLGAQPASENWLVITQFLKSPGFSEKLEVWIQNGGYGVPLMLIAVTLLAVNQHPQPVDDCPCFEDAIAFSGVVLGAIVGRWGVKTWQPEIESLLGIGSIGGGRGVVMPGSGWIWDVVEGSWMQVERTIWDVLIWWGVAATKMVLGVLVIFAWRILAKSLLHIALPPTFRFLAKSFQLPNRRFYTPATDYKSVPSEFNSEHGLRPIPSVIDLPITGEEIGGIGSGNEVRTEMHTRLISLRHHHHRQQQQQQQHNAHHIDFNSNGHAIREKDVYKDVGEIKEPPVKHYDADVLTKIVVYSGIAVLACEVVPIAFDLVGLGIRSSPP